jgi:TDG/mug DNA glycosylase family protein
MAFTRAEPESYRGATVPDLLPRRLRLLFVGINPGLWTAAAQSHFAPRGNRFYPALYAAGIVDRRIDASAGLSPEDRDHLLARGVGITNLVARATAAADELDRAELVAGAARLRRLADELRPRVIAVLGISAYRLAFAAPKAPAGRQPHDLGTAQLWVVPNPSGRNAHATAATLAAAYREAAEAAGIKLCGSG